MKYFQRPVLLLVAIPVLLAFLCGCDEEPRGLNVPTYPLPSPLDDIDISYIPYEYAVDGCWVRAPFLSMELAVAGIPSAAIHVQSCNNAFDLEGPDGLTWRHHVTVVIDDSGSLRVIDPMLSPDFLTEAGWLEAISSDDDARISFNPAAYPTGSAEQACGTRTGDEENMPETLEDMTPFLLANVMIHCAYMRDYLHQSGKDTEAREEHLIARTRELVFALDAIGLLDTMGDEESLSLLEAGPYCPDPISGP